MVYLIMRPVMPKGNMIFSDWEILLSPPELDERCCPFLSAEIASALVTKECLLSRFSLFEGV